MPKFTTTDPKNIKLLELAQARRQEGGYVLYHKRPILIDRLMYRRRLGRVEVTVEYTEGQYVKR